MTGLENLQSLMDDWNGAMPISEVAKKHGFKSGKSLYETVRACRKIGLNFRPKRETKYNWEQIAKDWNDGMAIGDIVKKHSFKSKKQFYGGVQIHRRNGTVHFKGRYKAHTPRKQLAGAVRKLIKTARGRVSKDAIENAEKACEVLLRH